MTHQFTCKSCSQSVMWVTMETGGSMLVNLPAEKRVVITEPSDGPSRALAAITDTYTSHFITCPATFKRATAGG